MRFGYAWIVYELWEWGMPVHDGRSIHCGDVTLDGVRRHYYALLHDGYAIGFVVHHLVGDPGAYWVGPWAVFLSVGDAIRAARYLEAIACLGGA